MCCTFVSLISYLLCSYLFGFVSSTHKKKILKCDLVFLGGCRQVYASYLFLYFLVPAPAYGVVEKQLNKQSKNENGTTR